MRELLAGRNLVTAYAYVVKSETAEGESAFFDALEKSGLELRSKDLQIFPGGQKKADWDVGMAVDAIRMCDPLDVVILVTGDGDFIPLVEYLRIGKGKTVEVAAFGRSSSGKIREAADQFIDIEKLPKVILRSNAISKRINN